MFSLFWLFMQSIAFVGAIGSNGSFPQPLSAEEEQKWVRRLIAGDEEAREKLIVHNLRLAAHIAKKYQKTERDREDLISIGTIGLIKAVSTFSESKGTLSAYAARCIENEILMSLRRERKLVETVSIEEPVGADKEGKVHTYGVTKEFRARFADAFDGLTRCGDLLAARPSAGEKPPAAARLGITAHCDVMIVTAVEIVEAMLAE